MRGNWVSVALLVGLGFSGSACRKNADPAPRPAPPAAPALIADARDQTGKGAGAVKDAGPTAAAPEPGPTEPLKHPPGERVPIESRFEVMYTPGETLPEQLRRRIRFRLRDKSRAPIALHHIIDIPRPDGGREVFALYESSVYEDCVQGYANRKQGRDHCLGELVKVVDMVDWAEEEHRGDRHRTKQVRLNRGCVALGAVRAVFGPPGPGEDADTGGSLAITSFAFPEGLCEVRSYNRVLVADVDGDKKLEMYVDITTEKEELRELRGPNGGYGGEFELSGFRRSLYILSGNDVNNVELSLGLAGWTSMNELVPAELVELRDIDRDGHLDVIQTKFCYRDPMDMGGDPCFSAPRDEKIAYLYDVKTDSYKEGVAMKTSAEEEALRPAPEGEEAAAPAPEGAAPAPEAAVPPPVPSDASRTVPQEAPAKAPSGEAPTKAPSGEAPAKAPSGEAPTKAPVGGAPAKAPSGEAPAKAPSGQAPAKAPSSGAPVQAPARGAPVQAPAARP